MYIMISKLQVNPTVQRVTGYKNNAFYSRKWNTFEKEVTTFDDDEYLEK